MTDLLLDEIAARLRLAKRIVLFSHTSPDGDTVGSVVALALALRSIGKEVQCVCDSPIPEFLSFLCERVQYTAEPSGNPDLLVSVDVASSNMLGKLAEGYADRIDLRIDHHEFGDDFAKANYCEPSAAAAAEIVAELLIRMDLLTPEVAAPLYTGLSTDTGSFRFANTTAVTHRIVATLIDTGIRTDIINEHLYENMSLDTLRTNAFFLENMESYLDGRVILVPVPESKRMEAGLSEENLSGLSTLARKISGVDLGISLREKTEGVYKISMRSKRSVDCARLCALFEGGGHLRAAGGTIRADSLEEAKKQLVSAVLDNIIFEDN